MGVLKGDARLACVNLSNYAERKQEITEQLMEAATTVGKRLTAALRRRGSKQAPAHQPTLTAQGILAMEEKPPMQKQSFAYILGWSQEKIAAGALREALLIGYDLPRMEGLWPSEKQCPGFKEEMLDFMFACHEVVEMIMECFARGLGLQEDFFTDEMNPHHEDNMTSMNLNMYPSTEGHTFPPGAQRIWSHTDYEALTLLFQKPGQTGLEVCSGLTTDRKKAQEAQWVAFDPVPGAITINIGDSLQYWSDGALKSTYHRVRCPTAEDYAGDRYSIAYFANGRARTILQGPKKKYPPIKFEQIVAQKSKYLTEEEVTSDDKYVEWQKKTAMGPEFDPVETASNYVQDEMVKPHSGKEQFYNRSTAAA
ncbi:TPA: hypothetical protein ACH3X1_005074 [Trebouxia sp. C0004]